MLWQWRSKGKCLKEYKSGGIKLLFTQPYKRSTVALSKYFASVVYSLGAVFAVILLIFLGNGVRNGFGDPNYPVEITQNYLLPTIFEPYNCNIMVPIWLRSLLTLLLIILAICAFNALSMLMSTIIKNRGIAIAVLDVVSIFFWVATYKYTYLSIDRFNMFSLSNFNNVNVMVAILHSIDNKVHVTFMDALLSFIIYSGVFSTLSVFIVKRKEITA